MTLTAKEVLDSQVGASTTAGRGIGWSLTRAARTSRMLWDHQKRREPMAISDVLYESAEEIREYMREMPEAYVSTKARLNRLLSTMDRVRAELDAAPPPKND